MFGKRKALGPDEESAVVTAVRAAAADLGAEVARYEERPGERAGRGVVAFHEDGFVVARSRYNIRTVAWRDVRNTVRSPGIVTVQCAPADVVFHRTTFETWPDVSADEVLRHAATALDRAYVETVEAVLAGRRVPFGEVELDRDGIHVGTFTLAWQRITYIGRQPGRLRLNVVDRRYQPGLHVPLSHQLDERVIIGLAQRFHDRTTELPVGPQVRAANFAEAMSSLDVGKLTSPGTEAAERLQDTGLAGCPRWYAEGEVTAALYDDGIAVDDGARVTVTRWDDIDHMPQIGLRSARRPAAMTHADHLMDRAADAISQGRSFPLGAVTLTADGFRLRGRTVTWQQVREVGNGPAGELVVQLREGRPLRVATGELTNPHTFAAFAALFTNAT